ncbi:MAG: Lrp/AsnC family transcriptional regulator [Nitrososphaerota archaeon]|jgi:DNA-binding Lrp family transcriptional regulator|nr:Lrp/AsnC family transcriptional regulator [Nitrososphaerota archaeon]
MDQTDIKLLTNLKKGIPLTDNPFNAIATELKIPTQEVIERLNQLKKDKIIRRFGATLKPGNIGLSSNALVAWKVPKDKIQEIANHLSEIKEISHCYERTTNNPNWTYNLYTVIHTQNHTTTQQILKELSTTLKIEYKPLYSTKDLKHPQPKEDTQC